MTTVTDDLVIAVQDVLQHERVHAAEVQVRRLIPRLATLLAEPAPISPAPATRIDGLYRRDGQTPAALPDWAHPGVEVRVRDERGEELTYWEGVITGGTVAGHIRVRVTHEDGSYADYLVDPALVTPLDLAGGDQ